MEHRDTYPFSGVCPICGATMVTLRLACGTCGSTLEGAFVLGARAAVPTAPAADARFSRLARLDAAQLEFVEAFIRCRGVIKNLEDMLGISYPTVKARLANVLETLGFTPEEELPAADDRRKRREILADLAAGRITTEEAHDKLAEVPSGDSDDETTRRA